MHQVVSFTYRQIQHMRDIIAGPLKNSLINWSQVHEKNKLSPFIYI